MFTTFLYSGQYCTLFNAPTSVLDCLFAFTISQFVLLRFYYAFRFPYGSIEFLIKYFPIFGILAEKDNNSPKQKLKAKVHKEKYVESFWTFYGVMISYITLAFSILFYLRIDRYMEQSFLSPLSSYISQICGFVICSGDMTLISRDASIPIFLRFIGALLIQYGIIISLWVHKEMKNSWTPAIHLREDHKLITSGPFQIVRHPMYYSFFIIGVGLSISSWNWFLCCLWLTTLIPTFFRIPVEEKLLSETYGEEYQKYRTTVKYAIIPYVY